jgi:hypothetical protein
LAGGWSTAGVSASAKAIPVINMVIALIANNTLFIMTSVEC